MTDDRPPLTDDQIREKFRTMSIRHICKKYCVSLKRARKAVLEEPR